jgi:hypothetical protein
LETTRSHTQTEMLLAALQAADDEN